ncbi:MAG TPA: DNA polymerase I [Tepidisphaeraceae bacterium]|nr:DNA polymerase I [Tepidisphaeraceae bacterium]
MPRKTFYLIDGHAHIYRSYFAPFRELLAPSGEPTKATFVFTQMLLNLAEKKKPDYLAMVIDHGDETVFRKKIFPEYKANRTKTPDDFYPQEKRILEIVSDSGVPIFEVPGFEADDIIATFADKLRDEFDVFMVSKDKDLRQLLDDHVVMYDVQTDTNIDPAALRARCGYGPEMSVEVQTLIGDSTDNVPGIPGIGEKTAAQLLEQFGSIDGIYANLDKLKSKKKLVENLVNFKDRLKVSRGLVTLRRDVPVELDITCCEFKGFNVEKVRPTLEMLGFRSLSAKMVEFANKSSASAPSDAPADAFAISLFGDAPPKTSGLTQTLAKVYVEPDKSDSPAIPRVFTSDGLPYVLVDTPELFASFLEELKKQSRFAFDTETDGVKPTQANLVGMSFCWQRETGFYLPIRGPMGCRILDAKSTLASLKPILEDERIEKIGHNIKYDLLVMRRAGINIKGVAGDTMLLAFLLDAGQLSYGIDSLALRQLNFRKISTANIIGTGKNQTTMDCVDVQSVARYASEDVDIVWRLDELLREKLQAFPLIKELYKNLELPIVDTLTEMEAAGIRVDPSVLREQSGVLGSRIADLHSEIMKQAGMTFNPDSPKQLAEVLFEKLKLPTARKTKTGYSTDVEVLEKLAITHPVPKLILEYRSLVKLKGTYLDALGGQINPYTGRIHTSFNITGAATGRLSSSDPNLQNIPIRTDEGRRIRLAFVAEKNHSLISADYSQIELRVLAHFTEEPALLRAFANDEDIHSTVASEVFGVASDQVTKDQRAQAKVINFGIIYGVTAMGLARRIDGLSLDAANTLIDTYNKRFPSIQRFMNECVMFAKSNGYVETIMGRRRPLPDINSGVINIRNMNERMAINSVVQGSAADLIKKAMIDLQSRITREKLPTRMLLQVHDELVLETPDEHVESIKRVVEETMTSAMKLKTPLKVEVGSGKNWGETK